VVVYLGLGQERTVLVKRGRGGNGRDEGGRLMRFWDNGHVTRPRLRTTMHESEVLPEALRTIPDRFFREHYCIVQ